MQGEIIMDILIGYLVGVALMLLIILLILKVVNLVLNFWNTPERIKARRQREIERQCSIIHDKFCSGRNKEK